MTLQLRKRMLVWLLALPLCFAGCDSDEQAAAPDAGNEIVQTPQEKEQNSASENQGSTASAPDILHGTNQADPTIVLDDFQIAILLKPTPLFESELFAVILDALSIAGSDSDPRQQLEQQLGISVTDIDHILLLGSIPLAANNTELEMDPESENEILETEKPDAESSPVEPVEKLDEAASPEPESSTPPPAFQYGAAINFASKSVFDQVTSKLLSLGFVPSTMDGQPVFRFPFPNGPVLHVKNETTLLLGSEPELKQMIAGSGGNNPLAESLTNVSGDHALAIVTHSESLLNAIPEMELQQAMVGNPYLAPIMEFMKKVQSTAIAVNPDADIPVYIELLASDKETTTDVFMQVNLFASLGKSLLPNQVKQFEANPNTDPVALETLRVANDLVQNILVEQHDNQITVSVSIDKALRTRVLDLAKNSIGNARQSARIIAASNHMKQIGLGLLQYHEDFGEFPVGESQAIQYAEGKPLLSWRVHILPYIEAQALYDEFHLDEPWDSEHNITLLERMPSSYSHPDHPELTTTTLFRAPVAEGSVLTSNKKQTFSTIRDGSSQTILVLSVGVEKATPWTKPDGIEVDFDNMAKSLGVTDDGRISVMYGDMSVTPMDISTSSETWRNLIHSANGK
ncbi:MAG: DUF1559 domain-containing protein [Planctomycetota bacterium]|nr:DUF1559 domain-containing protein [Planctomycetota bacterium]